MSLSALSPLEKGSEQVLKISTGRSGRKTVVLKLEGRVTGPWVTELERTCEDYLSRGRQLVLDLSGVNFVDDQGIRVLRNLTKRRVALVECSVFLMELFRKKGVPNPCQRLQGPTPRRGKPA